MSRVEEARAQFEARLADTREAVTRELGGVPRLALWFVPLAAAAAGLALGLKMRRKRRRVSRPSGA